jgi:hypothetical protein
MSVELKRWYEEVTIKVMLLTCSGIFAFETVATAQMPDPIETGKRAETLGIVGILAALIVILVIALVLVYRGKEDAALRREERLEGMIREVAGVIATNTEASHVSTQLMVDVRNTLANCHARNVRGA